MKSWLKKLTALHERPAAQMKQLLMDGTYPDWLTQGWTVPIVKVFTTKVHKIWQRIFKKINLKKSNNILFNGSNHVIAVITLKSNRTQH